MRLDDQSPEFPESFGTSAPVAPAPLTLRNALYEGDCLDILARIPAASVDMILCDLPYGTTQTSGTASSTSARSGRPTDGWPSRTRPSC